LPVRVDGDGIAFIDEGFNVWYERFTTSFDVVADVFAAISRVVLVLWSISRYFCE
jgi:hypothetical protein